MQTLVQEKFSNLTEENILEYAMDHYDNPSCRTPQEFDSDYSRMRHLKRLLRRYKRKGELKERLILNHITILRNVFGNEAMIRMLFFEMEEELWDILKTFLDYFDFMPEIVYGVHGRNIRLTEIEDKTDVRETLQRMVS